MKAIARFGSIVALVVSMFMGVARADGEFTTIQAAIDAANPGDVVHVPAGTYRERIILKQGIMLMGQGADSTIIDGKGLPECVGGHKDTAIIGFTIRNGVVGVNVIGCFMGVFDCRFVDIDNSGIQMRAGSGIFHNNIILGSGGTTGVNTTNANPMVVNNTIADHTFGVRASGSHVLTLTNNVFVSNSVDMKMLKGASAILDGNVFSEDAAVPPAPQVAEIEVYRAMMRAAFDIVTAEHTAVRYTLTADGSGRFGCSISSPSATFHIKTSTKDTEIEEFSAYDQQTGDTLRAKLLRKKKGPGVDVKNQKLRELALDRYILDQTYDHLDSLFENEAGQLVFKRTTTLSRIQILLPPGYIPYSVNYPAEVTSEDGQVLLTIVDVGFSHVELIMEAATE